MIRTFRFPAGALLLLLFAARLAAAAPDWLLADAALPARAKVAERGAEILRREVLVTVNADGSWQQTLRYALRVDHSGGTGRAVIGVPYVERADRITRAEAWQVRAGRVVKNFPRREWLDRISVDEATLYSDFRTFAVGCPAPAVGDVFGGEVVLNRTSNAGQEVMDFSPELPARLQRLEIRVPRGWNVRVWWLNGKGPEPRIQPDRSTWAWEVRDQPEEKDEPWASEQPALVAAVTIEPPAGSRPAALPALDSWAQVAAWLYQLQNPQCDTGPDLVATVRRLTAGLTEPVDKITALTRFVQERRYIQVNRNSGLGFGYRPRKATEVLAADYGDCKDKSNLLRAMLREAGFESHLVAAYIGDRDAVRPEWPSPAQFNHAILAIKLQPGTQVPGATDDPVLGPVLFFDSTARWIPAGHLPWVLQGGRGMVCDAEGTGLVAFPRSADANEYRLEARIEITLAADGSCTGQVLETRRGQLAAEGRNWAFVLSEKERKEYWMRRLGATVRGVVVEELATETAADLWGFTSTVRFKSPLFGQRLRDEMMVLNLDVLTRDSVPVFPEAQRQHDLLVRPIHMVTEMTLNLPAVETVELPSERRVVSEYGEYTGHYTREGARVVYRRVLQLNPVRVAPAQYPAFRQFMLEVAKAERTAVIARLAPK